MEGSQLVKAEQYFLVLKLYNNIHSQNNFARN